VCAQTTIFSAEPCSKNAGESTIVLGITAWRVEYLKKTNNPLPPAIQTEIELNFGGFFQQIKVRQPIGRKDSKKTVIPTSRRLDSFLYEAAQNFELFSNIQDQN
jgi:hypothetical protein